MQNIKCYETDRCIQETVIIATIKRRGKGTEDDPIRIITQVFDLKGNLIAETDPL